MSVRAVAAAVLVLAACAGDDDGLAPDGGGDGGGGCDLVAPVDEPAWLADYLSGQVATLAAAPRATVAERDTARGYLAGELSALGLATELRPYPDGSNVVAHLMATTASDRWLVLGAHFDTVSDSPGANDNATGVAIVLAVARAMNAQPCRTANLALVMFDQEEIGLVGSANYAASLRADGTDVIAAHTIDQAGWDADDDLRFEVELPDGDLFAQYQEASAAVGASVVTSTVGSTDHSSFRSEGFAAAGLTEEYVSGDTTPHYHRPTDTADTVDGAYHRVAARLMIHLFARQLGASAP